MNAPTREFRLLDLPVDLHACASAHLDALQREFELIRRGQEADDTVPARLRALIDDLQSRYGGVGERFDEILRMARDEGRTSVDLVLPLPAGVAEASQELLDLLAEADEYCRNGDLLTLATPPAELAFREWFLGELVTQGHGAAPRSWKEYSAGLTLEAAEPSPPAPTGKHPDAAVPVLPEGWSLQWEPGTLRARLGYRGELDLQSAPSMRSLIAAMRGLGVERLELDLTGVTFIDSVALSVLLSSYARLEAEGVSMSVAPSPTVGQLLDLAGVTALLAG